ncbi:MAG: Ig-like domain-containing protein [Gemmatimonadetes bacterium]|nr:Ig-like domain-containing protein [Gemmatimonadota bacterium]MDA1103402.1 Ig-like domain-containing protein [Gemmatimonadota bacterium]
MTGRAMYCARQLILLALLAITACSGPFVPARGFLTVTPTGQQMQVGGSVTLHATGLSAERSGPYALGTVTWSSSDESVARVTTSQRTGIFGDQHEATVLGIGVGTASITASSDRAGESSAEVVVVPAV